MKLLVVFSVFALMSYLAEGRVFDRCGLVHELRRQGFPEDKMRDWVCLVEAESARDTSKVGTVNKNGSRDHGLFQINDKYWCTASGPAGNDCHVTCSNVTTDDVTEASVCAKKIFKRHGFVKGWAGYRAKCQAALPDISHWVCLVDGSGEFVQHESRAGQPGIRIYRAYGLFQIYDQWWLLVAGLLARTATLGAESVEVVAEFNDVSPDALYDVLHDPEYRTVWDTHMLCAEDAGHINVNNDVGYYAMSCPAPLKNRDFVLQRSWLDTGDEKLILNHSVFHKDFPPRKGFVRAQSLLTGFAIRPKNEGSWLGYVSRSDPRGALPAWLVNRVTAQLAPRLVHQLHDASRRYPGWKALTDTPYFKPWRHPEQVPSFRIALADCVDPDAPPHPEQKPESSTSHRLLPVPQAKEVCQSVEDLGDISSEFSVEVEEEPPDQLQDPVKRKGKFYRLVKTMKNRRKSVAKSSDHLEELKPGEDKPEKSKKGFKFHRRFSLSRGRED